MASHILETIEQTLKQNRPGTSAETSRVVVKKEPHDEPVPSTSATTKSSKRSSPEIRADKPEKKESDGMGVCLRCLKRKPLTELKKIAWSPYGQVARHIGRLFGIEDLVKRMLELGDQHQLLLCKRHLEDLQPKVKAHPSLMKIVPDKRGNKPHCVACGALDKPERAHVLLFSPTLVKQLDWCLRQSGSLIALWSEDPSNGILACRDHFPHGKMGFRTPKYCQVCGDQTNEEVVTVITQNVAKVAEMLGKYGHQLDISKIKKGQNYFACAIHFYEPSFPKTRSTVNDSKRLAPCLYCHDTVHEDKALSIVMPRIAAHVEHRLAVPDGYIMKLLQSKKDPNDLLFVCKSHLDGGSDDEETPKPSLESIIQSKCNDVPIKDVLGLDPAVEIHGQATHQGEMKEKMEKMLKAISNLSCCYCGQMVSSNKSIRITDVLDAMFYGVLLDVPYGSLYQQMTDDHFVVPMFPVHICTRHVLPYLVKEITVKRMKGVFDVKQLLEDLARHKRDIFLTPLSACLKVEYAVNMAVDCHYCHGNLPAKDALRIQSEHTAYSMENLLKIPHGAFSNVFKQKSDLFRPQLHLCRTHIQEANEEREYVKLADSLAALASKFDPYVRPERRKEPYFKKTFARCSFCLKTAMSAECIEVTDHRELASYEEVLGAEPGSLRMGLNQEKTDPAYLCRSHFPDDFNQSRAERILAVGRPPTTSTDSKRKRQCPEDVPSTSTAPPKIVVGKRQKVGGSPADVMLTVRGEIVRHPRK